MTKKHFEAIAAMISDLKSFPNSTIEFDDGFRAALSMVEDNLSDIFTEANPRFDRDRFLDACRPVL